jgi:hypothetical protein
MFEFNDEQLYIVVVVLCIVITKTMIKKKKTWVEVLILTRMSVGGGC